MPLIPKHPRIAPTAPPFDDDTRAARDILGPPIALFGVFARRPDRAEPGREFRVLERGVPAHCLVVPEWHLPAHPAGAKIERVDVGVRRLQDGDAVPQEQRNVAGVVRPDLGSVAIGIGEEVLRPVM